MSSTHGGKEETARKRAIVHVLRLYERPLKQVVYLPMALPFVATGVAMIYSAVIRSKEPTLARIFALALGGFSVASFGLGSVVFLYSVGRRLLRPHLVGQPANRLP
jgi:hypothetical protein